MMENGRKGGLPTRGNVQEEVALESAFCVGVLRQRAMWPALDSYHGEG